MIRKGRSVETGRERIHVEAVVKKNEVEVFNRNDQLLMQFLALWKLAG